MPSYTTPYELTIRKVENGYVCSWQEEISSEPKRLERKQIVFEIPESERDERIAELTALQKTINYVIEHFGLHRSKYASANLVTRIEAQKDKDKQ